MLHPTTTLTLPAPQARFTPDLRGHMPVLDGLRGIAVLLVMAFHFTWFSGITVETTAMRVWYHAASAGWMGVDLFFVLSGFLITGILYEAKGTTGYFRTFYARRVLRIFPLYYVFLAIFFLVLPHFLSLPGIALRNPADQVWFWTHFSNVLLALQGDWSATSLYIVHFWSLAVEEQFYLIWPLIVLLLPQRKLLAFCAAMMVFSLSLRMVLFAASAGGAAYVLTPARMDTLAFGAVLALMLRDPQLYASARKWARPVAVACIGGVAAIVVARNGLNKNDAVTGTIGFTLLAGLFTVAVFAAVVSRSAYTRCLTAPALRFFGKYSYALYVFHQPVALMLEGLGLSRAIAEIGVKGLAAQLAFAAIALAVTIALALSSWNLCEKHFLKLKDRFAQRQPAADGHEKVEPAVGGWVAPAQAAG
jgi:peptidoglycan/LPS O-acetylase OafA/YrhL